MRKTIALFLCLLLLFAAAACAKPAAPAAEPAAGVPNPVEEVSSLDDVNKAVGCCFTSLADYYSLTGVSFSLIHAEPLIGQYRFDAEGTLVTLRAAVTQEDISGIYLDDGTQPTDKLTKENPYAIVNCGTGLYTRWFLGGMQYSLYVTGRDAEDKLWAIRDCTAFTWEWYTGENSEAYWAEDPEEPYAAEYVPADPLADACEIALNDYETLRALNEKSGTSFGPGSRAAFSGYTPEALKSDRTVKEVSTVDELLAAIAPDTLILLKPGVYALSTASGYGTTSGAYYRWEDAYDGYELVIERADNLIIAGTVENGAPAAAILASPRYANVITFRRCMNAGIAGITAGHSEGIGECCGGVIYLTQCPGFTVNACSLYGCGIIAVDAEYSENLTVTDSLLHHCSTDLVSLSHCNNAVFSGCSLTSGEGFADVCLYECSHIVFNDCAFGYSYAGNYFYADKATDNVILNNCCLISNGFGTVTFKAEDNAPAEHFTVNGGAALSYSDTSFGELAFG